MIPENPANQNFESEHLHPGEQQPLPIDPSNNLERVPRLVDPTLPLSESDHLVSQHSSIRTRLTAINGNDWKSPNDKLAAFLNYFAEERESFAKNDLSSLLGYLAALPMQSLGEISEESKGSIFQAVSKVAEELDLEETAKFLNLARMLKYEDSYIQHSRTKCFENIDSLSETRALITCQSILSSEVSENEKSKVISWLNSKLSSLANGQLLQAMDIVSASKLSSDEFVGSAISRLQELRNDLLSKDFHRGLATLVNIKSASLESKDRLAHIIFESRTEYRSEMFISIASKLVVSGYHNPEFVRVVVENSLGRTDSLSGKECFQLVKMFETAKWRHPGYLSEIGNRLSDVAFHTDPNLLAEVAVSFAKLDIRMPRLMSSVAALSPVKLSHLSANKLKSLLGACAAENIIPVNLLSFIDQELPKKDLAERYLASSMWSYSVLNEPCPHIVSKMREIGPDLIKKDFFDCSDAALVMRSAVVLDQEFGKEFWQNFRQHKQAMPAHGVGLFPSTKLDQEIGDLKGPALYSLYHSLVSLKLEVPEWLSQRARSMERYEEYKAPKINSFESSVRRELDRIGIRAESQKWFEGYYIDFVVEHDGRKIALECDGFKYHSAGMQAQARLNGKSIMKEEFLKARGFEVVRIPSRAWLQVSDKKEFLHQILKLDRN
jgi:very-short-patch-repair endonuclease